MSMLELWLLFIVVPKLAVLGCFAFTICLLTILGAIIWQAFMSDVHDTNIRRSESVEKLNELEVKYNNKKTALFKCAKKTIISCLVVMILSLGAPTQKEMALLVVTPAILNNPEVQKLPTSLVKYLNNLLTEPKEK